MILTWLAADSLQLPPALATPETRERDTRRERHPRVAWMIELIEWTLWMMSILLSQPLQIWWYSAGVAFIICLPASWPDWRARISLHILWLKLLSPPASEKGRGKIFSRPCNLHMIKSYRVHTFCCKLNWWVNPFIYLILWSKGFVYFWEGKYHWTETIYCPLKILDFLDQASTYNPMCGVNFGSQGITQNR